MVVTVLLTGVPQYVTLEDLAQELNVSLTVEDVGCFFAREEKHPTKPGKRLIALDFKNGFDAMMAQHQLDGFKYKLPNDREYVLSAKVTQDPELMPSSPVYSNALVSYNSRRATDTELDDELKTLNKQLKIMKKKRKLARETRKLMEAQKKSMRRSESSDSEGERRRKKRRRGQSSSSSSLSDSSDTSRGRRRRRSRNKRRRRHTSSSLSPERKNRRRSSGHRSRRSKPTSSVSPVRKNRRHSRGREKSRNRSRTSNPTCETKALVPYLSSRNTSNLLRSPQPGPSRVLLEYTETEASREQLPKRTDCDRKSRKSVKKDADYSLEKERRKQSREKELTNYKLFENERLENEKPLERDVLYCRRNSSHRDEIGYNARRYSRNRDRSRRSGSHNRSRRSRRSRSVSLTHHSSHSNRSRRSRRSRSVSPTHHSSQRNRHESPSRGVYVDRKRFARLDMVAASNYYDHTPTRATVTEIHDYDDDGDNMWQSVNDILMDVDHLTEGVEKSPTPEDSINEDIETESEQDTLNTLAETNGMPLPIKAIKQEHDCNGMPLPVEAIKKEHDGNTLTDEDIQRAMPKPIYDHKYRMEAKKEDIDDKTELVKIVSFMKKQISKNPKFVLPVRKILNKMKVYTNTVETEKKDFYMSIMRKIIRLRLETILKGKEYMKTCDIVVFYREHYNEDDDGEFAETVLRDMYKGKFGGFVASDVEEETVKPQKVQPENQPDFSPYIPSKKKAGESKENIAVKVESREVELDDDIVVIEKKVDVVDLLESDAQFETSDTKLSTASHNPIYSISSDEDEEIVKTDPFIKKEEPVDEIEDGEITEEFDKASIEISDIVKFEVNQDVVPTTADDENTLDLSDRISAMVSNIIPDMPELKAGNNAEIAVNSEINNEDIRNKTQGTTQKFFPVIHFGTETSVKDKEPQTDSSKVIDFNVFKPNGESGADKEKLPTLSETELVAPVESVDAIKTVSEPIVVEENNVEPTNNVISGEASLDIVKKEPKDTEESVESIGNFVDLVTNVIDID